MTPEQTRSLAQMTESTGLTLEQLRERSLTPQSCARLAYLVHVMSENVGTYLMDDPIVFLDDESYALARAAYDTLTGLLDRLSRQG
jgi:translation initiation factor RLI1